MICLYPMSSQTCKQDLLHYLLLIFLTYRLLLDLSRYTRSIESYTRHNTVEVFDLRPAVQFNNNKSIKRS